jgi:hypothetical protein
MKQNKNSIYFPMLLLFINLLLTGCSKVISVTRTQISSPVLIQTKYDQITTKTQTPTPVLKFDSTPTPLRDTPKPIHLTPTNSQTPLPTLQIEEAEALVLELLKTKSECTLPCWWGIIPGITSAEEIKNILWPFKGTVEHDLRYEFSDSGGYLLMKTQPNGFNIGIQYLIENEKVSTIYISTRMNDIDGYELVYKNSEYDEIMELYSVDQILTRYGKPEQIYIRSFSEIAGELNPTQILLFYPDEGVIVQYFSPNTLEIDNGEFYNTFCPLDGHIMLRLFNPNTDINLDKLLLMDDNFSSYKEISKVTNMDVNSFYNTYVDGTDCSVYLYTKESIWPYVYDNR